MKWYNREIMIIRNKPSKVEIAKLFIKSGEFIKVVVDIERGTLAAGGELHSDEEKILLEDGSEQKDLWGANYYPKENRVEYKSLINIRSREKNYSQQIENEEIRDKVKEIVLQLLGL